MTDFVKVNYKSGFSIIHNKNNIEIYMYEDGACYVNNIVKATYMGAAMSGHSSVEEKAEYYNKHLSNGLITREEYDRLCKELGVEG